MSLQLLATNNPESANSSGKNSLIETLTNTQVTRRKDSVAPLGVLSVQEGVPSETSSSCGYPDGSVGPERTRRLSRKLSLKPPSNVYRERRESHPKGSQPVLHDGRHLNSIGQHNVTCECGRDLVVPCQGVVVPTSSDSIASLVTEQGFQDPELSSLANILPWGLYCNPKQAIL